jgi:YEATS family
MTLRVAQDARYDGDGGKDWWKWSVWLDGPDSELDEVVSVEWMLHPSFPNPIRKVTNRQSQFKLKTGGWGGFVIRARVKRTNRKITLLKHSLKLEYPSERRTKSRSKGGPRVYLSYTSSSLRAVEIAKEFLKERAICWSDASFAAEGSETLLRATLANDLAHCDAVLDFRSGPRSPWAEWEISTARAHGVPVMGIRVPAAEDGADEDSVSRVVRSRLDKLVSLYVADS